MSHFGCSLHAVETEVRRAAMTHRGNYLTGQSRAATLAHDPGFASPGGLSSHILSCERGEHL